MQNYNFNVELHNKHECKKYNAKSGDRILAEIVLHKGLLMNSKTC